MRGFLDDGLRGIDEVEKDGADDEHEGNHVEGQIVVARRLDELPEEYAAAETSDVTCRVHGSREDACLVLAQVDA